LISQTGTYNETRRSHHFFSSLSSRWLPLPARCSVSVPFVRNAPRVFVGTSK